MTQFAVTNLFFLVYVSDFHDGIIWEQSKNQHLFTKQAPSNNTICWVSKEMRKTSAR